MASPPPSTLYMPILSPPTPAPSPRLTAFDPIPVADRITDPASSFRREFAVLPSHLRFHYLSSIVSDCNPTELLFLSTLISPKLKRDFLRDLPVEISLHVLSFIEDPQTLARASRVSQSWRKLLSDQFIWKRLCIVHGYLHEDEYLYHGEAEAEDDIDRCSSISVSAPTTSSLCLQPVSESPPNFSYLKYFQREYTTTSNWLRGGRLLRMHRISLVRNNQLPADHDPPGVQPSSAIPTSVAIDEDWVVVGLANSRIHVFSARTGVLSRTLVGHESGVWAVSLVRGNGDAGDERAASGEPGAGDPLMPPTLRRALGLDPASPGPSNRLRSASDVFEAGPRRRSEWRPRADKPSDPNGTSDGWGQPHALVVSGGCDKELRVWDIKSGYCIYILHGHTSTIRCLKVLHGRPIAVSGSRDRTLRVWDIQRGRMLRVLEGHEQSVRCLDVCGSRVVSGSYDCTCRVWDVDTGACLHVLRGHLNQIYTVAFDGVRIASGGLDTTVRVWDAETGACLALLPGHTALVCQLQLSPTMLATGGSDGRVIIFSLMSFSTVKRLAAHDSSVTGLQLNERFLVTSGNDGRVRLFRFDRAQTALALARGQQPVAQMHTQAVGTAQAQAGQQEGLCEYVRELSDPSESVWKVAFTRETCAIMCKRAGKTVMEIWSFKSEDTA